jgi:hypothetical protein
MRIWIGWIMKNPYMREYLGRGIKEEVFRVRVNANNNTVAVA